MKITKEALLNSLTLELKKKKQSWVAYIPFIIAFTWVLLLFLPPLLMPHGTIYLGNEGKVSVPDNADYINTHIHNPLFRGVYLIGDVMCHQHANRSFFINGNQMPFCSRCTGIFLGLAFGLLVGGMFKVRMGAALYLLGLVPLGLDGVIQLLTAYESTNFNRIVTGMIVGTFSALVFAYIFYDSKTNS